MSNNSVTGRMIRLGGMLVAVSVLQACSWFQSDEDAALEPAELVDFVEEMELREVWDADIGDGQGDYYNRLQIALYGGRIFGASSDGTVAAYDADSGREIWETELDEVSISGGVGVGGDLALVGTTEGYVIALDAETGRELWRSQLSSEVLSAPGADWDSVVVHTLDGWVAGLDASSGERRWRLDTSMPLLTLRGGASVVMREGAAYVGLSNGHIKAYKADTGELLWDGRVAQAQGQSDIERVVDIDGTPVIIGQNMYAVTYQGKLGAIGLGNGRTLWTRDASSYMSVAEGFGNLYVAEAEGAVSAFEVNGGALRWKNSQYARRQLSSPAVFSNYVAVGDFEGYLHILSQVDGHQVGRERVDSSGVNADMIGVGDKLYVYDNDGGLTCYEPR